MVTLTGSPFKGNQLKAETGKIVHFWLQGGGADPMDGGCGRGGVEGRRWSSNLSGKCSYERPARGTVCGTIADAGCLAINYQSLMEGRRRFFSTPPVPLGTLQRMLHAFLPSCCVTPPPWFELQEECCSLFFLL